MEIVNNKNKDVSTGGTSIKSSARAYIFVLSAQSDSSRNMVKL